MSIKDDASLLAEFTATTVDSLRDKLASEEGTSGNDTFMNIDVGIQDSNRMKTDQNTYEGLGSTSSKGVDLSTETYGPSIESGVPALDDAPTGAFPIPNNYEPTDMIGRYIDLGILGEGGMGEVRKVHDGVLKRNLAMKIIHSSMLSSRNALSRFTEEAQVGAQLQHPNLSSPFMNSENYRTDGSTLP